ncbi:MAG: TOBE domain-containing protein, partial [Myxococcales bacterium]
AEALSMADRIVVLSEGRILQAGTPREIYQRPVSPVVALQLGQPAINLLPVKRRGGHWTTPDGTALLPAAAQGSDERLLGIRPEDLLPEVPGAGASTPSPIDAASTPVAVVEIVEYIGPTTTLLCAWAGSRVHVIIPRRGALRPGDRIHLRLDPARVVLFDAALPPSPASFNSPSSLP